MYRKDKKREVYTIKAREEGYPARSVYKLKEINEKFHLIKKGYRVLDLGSAPGSWLKCISEIVGDRGTVTGVDLNELRIDLPKNAGFIQEDIYQLGITELFSNTNGYDIITSDMAPKTTGIISADCGVINDLVYQTLLLAEKILVEKGSLIAKIFEGNDTREIIKEAKINFKTVRIFRPKATTKHSKEIYLIATGHHRPAELGE